MDLGVVGINLEDRVVHGTGLHGIEMQTSRIAAIRSMAIERGVPLFINARTDLFLGTGRSPLDGIAEAKERAAAYALAGASGFFVPGLIDMHSIRELSEAVELPLNVMVMPGAPDADDLANAGVARISHGPAPYLLAAEALRNACARLQKVEAKT